MDEYIFSPLEWEVQAMKDDKKIYCSIRDYDSPNTSVYCFTPLFKDKRMSLEGITEMIEPTIPLLESKLKAGDSA